MFWGVWLIMTNKLTRYIGHRIKEIKNNIITRVKNIDYKQTLIGLLGWIFLLLVSKTQNLILKYVFGILCIVFFIIFIELNNYIIYDKSGTDTYLKRKKIFKKLGMDYDKIDKNNILNESIKNTSEKVNDKKL